MTVYILIWLVIVVFAFFEVFSLWGREKTPSKTIILIGLGILLTLVSGLRYKIGYDYESYLDVWNFIGPSHSVLNFYVEPLFGALVVLAFIFIGYYQGLLILVACLAIIPKFRFIRKYAPLPFMAALLYFSRTFLIYDMGQIRQGMAFALILFSIKPLLEKKVWLFLAMVLVAVLIHVSAICFIPAYFFARRRISNKWAIGILVVSMLLAFVDLKPLASILISFLPSFVQSKLLFYLSTEDAVGLSFAMLFRVVIIAIYLLFRNNIKHYDKQVDIYFNLYFIGACIYFIFNSFPEVALRISAYYLLFELMLVPMILYLTRDRWIKLGIYGFLLVYSLWGVITTLLTNDGAFIPYQSILGF